MRKEIGERNHRLIFGFISPTAAADSVKTFAQRRFRSVTVFAFSFAALASVSTASTNWRTDSRVARRTRRDSSSALRDSSFRRKDGIRKVEKVLQLQR